MSRVGSNTSRYEAQRRKKKKVLHSGLPGSEGTEQQQLTAAKAPPENIPKCKHRTVCFHGAQGETSEERLVNDK